MMLFESLIFNLLPAAVGIMAVVLVFESCWRKCPHGKDKPFGCAGPTSF